MEEIVKYTNSTDGIVAADSNQDPQVTVSSDGTIYLPLSNTVTFETSSPEASPWPKDVRTAVIRTEKPSTRLQKYLALIFIVAILAIGSGIIYAHSRYRIVMLREPDLIESEFPGLDKENRSLYKRAKSLAEKGKYIEAFRTLKGEACDISVKHQRDRYLVCAGCFEYYAKSAFQKWEIPEDLASVKEALEALKKDEPDRLLWIRYYVDITCRDYYGYEDVWSEIKAGRWKSDRIQYGTMVPEVEKCVALLGKAVRLAEQQNDPSLDYLNCRRAELLTTLWLLEGSEGKSASLPDDERDPGVLRRERAWKIAIEYPNNKDFLEIRRFIAKTILDQHNIPANQFFWNGISYMRTDALKIELERINGRLANPLETKGK